MRSELLKCRTEKDVALLIPRQISHCVHDVEQPLMRACRNEQHDVSLVAYGAELFLMQFVATNLSLYAFHVQTASHSLGAVVKFNDKVEVSSIASHKLKGGVGTHRESTGLKPD